MDGVYEPELYDLATPRTFGGDVEFYCRQVRECGSPVLELGEGTGRVTLPLARAGASVYALEIQEGMLAALRRKVAEEAPEVRERVVLVQADMRAFGLEPRFSLAIAPFRVVLHNLTDADQLACFQCVREHLRTGGRFVFNVFHPSLEYMAQHAGAFASVWRWTETLAQPDGGFVMRSEANRYDTVRRRVHSQHRYENYGPDGVLRRTFLHRLELAYLFPADVRRLLTNAGFRSVEIAGGFDGRPFERDTDELVVEARVD